MLLLLIKIASTYLSIKQILAIYKSRQPKFQKKPLNRIWAPYRLGLPVMQACLPQLEWTRFRRTCCFQKMGLTAKYLFPFEISFQVFLDVIRLGLEVPCRVLRKQLVHSQL